MLKGETEMNLFGKKFALVLALIAVLAMAGSALAADIYVSVDGIDENGRAHRIFPIGQLDSPSLKLNQTPLSTSKQAHLRSRTLQLIINH